MELNSGISELDQDSRIVADQRCFIVLDSLSRKWDALPSLDLASVPSEYAEWLRRVGPAKLLREFYTYSHKIAVNNAPSIIDLSDGVQVLNVGAIMGRSVFFLANGRGGWNDEVVLLGSAPALVRTGCSFYEWLEKQYSRAKKGYRVRDWKALVNGGAPFSEVERRILEWRSKIIVERIENDRFNNVQLLLTNTADEIMPYFSVNLTSLNASFSAALRTDLLGKNCRQLYRLNCHKTLFRPDDIEVNIIRDPIPDDRPRIIEFNSESLSRVEQFLYELDLDKLIYPKQGCSSKYFAVRL